MQVSAQHRDAVEVLIRSSTGRRNVYRIDATDSPLCVTVDTDPDAVVIRPPVVPVTPDGFDLGVVPSRLFDDLYFLMFRGALRRGDVIVEKCPPLQFRLFWYLDCFDGVADLDNAVRECWGKKIGDDLTLKGVRNNFYRLDEIFLELSLNAAMVVTSTTATINR